VLEVQGGFKWPHFDLSAAILSEVGIRHQDEQEVKFRLYNTTIRTWTTVRIGHVITLRDGDHIFLKRPDVIHCLNFDDLLFGSQGRKPHWHFSKNLPHDRAYVRQALKAKKTQIEKIVEIPSSEEEEEEVVEKDEHRSQASRQTSTHRQTSTSTRPLLIPQRFKVEPSDFAIPLTTINTLSQRTALHPPHVAKVEPTVIDLTISDSENDDAPPVTMTPLPRKRARSSNSLSPSSSPSTPSSSSSPRLSTASGDADDNDDSLPAWPSAFYVVDIVHGFEKCEAAARSRKSVKEAFTKCFHIPFRHSTFYVHRRH
jgi:hypothetical protein